MLTAAGECPGQLMVSVTGTTPGGPLAILGGAGIGGAYLTAGPCAGTSVPLAGPIRLIGSRIFTSDPIGAFNAMPTVGADVCGTALVALDVATCAPSAAVALP